MFVPTMKDRLSVTDRLSRTKLSSPEYVDNFFYRHSHFSKWSKNEKFIRKYTRNFKIFLFQHVKVFGFSLKISKVIHAMTNQGGLSADAKKIRTEIHFDSFFIVFYNFIFTPIPDYLCFALYCKNRNFFNRWQSHKTLLFISN